jgi:trk system potassium uptake protein TrkA
MHVIVCGAGQVGSTIARHLANEKINVTVIDSDPAQARRVDESYDVRGIVGHASHPGVLEGAGAAGADMLIAVTRFDEVNMVACEVAHALFGVKRRIARVRHEGYINPALARLYRSDRLAIDVIISPEYEVAQGIARRLATPGAFDSAMLAHGAVQLLGVHCNVARSPAIGRRMDEVPALAPGAALRPVALVRGGAAFIPAADERLQLGDDLYALVDPRRARELISLLGHDEKIARRALIIGAGNVGLNLARHLALTAPSLSMRIVENSRPRAEYVSRLLGDQAIVVHGDALDRDVLVEANAALADVVVAITNDDETNIFSSVLAKREGCGRAITLVNKSSYEPLLEPLGVDVVVNPNAITISTLLRQLRPRSIAGVYALREDFGEIVEAVAQRGSPLVDRPLSEFAMPEGILLGAVARGGRMMGLTGDLRIEPGDDVVVLVRADALSAAEELLAGEAGADQQGQGE